MGVFDISSARQYSNALRSNAVAVNNIYRLKINGISLYINITNIVIINNLTALLMFQVFATMVLTVLHVIVKTFIRVCIVNCMHAMSQISFAKMVEHVL